MGKSCENQHWEPLLQLPFEQNSHFFVRYVEEIIYFFDYRFRYFGLRIFGVRLGVFEDLGSSSFTCLEFDSFSLELSSICPSQISSSIYYNNPKPTLQQFISMMQTYNGLPNQYPPQSFRGSLIAVVNVEISKSLSDKIEIHEYDDDEQLALAFISKHRLPEKAFQILVGRIVQSRQSVMMGGGKVGEERKRNDRNCRNDNRNDRNGREQEQQQQPKTSRIQKPQPTHRTQLTEAQSRLKTHRTQLDPNTDTQKISLFTRKDQSSKISLSPSKSQSQSQSRLTRCQSTQVITSRLYNESMAKHDFVRRIQARAQQKTKTPVQQAELTYRPKINEISEELARRRRSGNDLPIEERLSREGVALQQKRQRARSQHLKSQQSQYSFRPHLTPITRKLLQNPSIQKSHHRQPTQFPTPTFHPQIDKLSSLIMSHRGDFHERNKQFQQSKLMKMKQMYSELRRKEVVDLETGRPLFRPSLREGRQGENRENRERGKKSIGEYLYEMGRHKKEVKQETKKVEVNRNSEVIVRGMQARRVAWLFSEMDADQDGKISAAKCSIDRIPEPILEIIMPILFEMEDFNFQLTVEDFQQAIQSLNKSLTSQQKSILYDYRRKNNYDPCQGLTFKPDLSK